MTSFAAHIKRAGLAVMALSSMVLYQSAFAGIGETTAGTDISNVATVNYQVGGVSQTAVNSAAAIFKVDRKVIFTVTELSLGNTPNVGPGQLNVVTAFTVANAGNAAEGFQLTAANLVGGAVFGNTDNQNMNNLRVFVDANGNGTYQSGTDTQTVIDTLARDTSVVVFIVADAPIAATNGQFANVSLTARAAVAGTGAVTLETESATDSIGTEDVVIADTGRNNSETDNDQYAIVSATLSVVKTSVVLADPINCPGGVGSCGANTPKAIPGATVQYSIVVTNNGAANATSVALTDNIPTNTAYRAGSMTLNAAALTDGADADAGTTTGIPVTSISVNAGTVNASGGTATITFRVTVN